MLRTFRFSAATTMVSADRSQVFLDQFSIQCSDGTHNLLYTAFFPNRNFIEIDTAVGYYVSMFPMMLHGIIYVFASNGILGIFISLYFYIDAACIDFQYSISNIDIIQVEISALDGPAREMRQIAKRKMHFIEIVSLHQNINE